MSVATITRIDAGSIDWLARADRIAKEIAEVAARHDADESFVSEGYQRLKEEGFAPRVNILTCLTTLNYRSVCDMTAEFYLQTVDVVFQKHELPKGEMEHRGRLVKPDAIRDLAAKAGFAQVRHVEMDNPFNSLYELTR